MDPILGDVIDTEYERVPLGGSAAGTQHNPIPTAHRAGPGPTPREPRLAAFDIDGTLLDPTGRIRPKVRRALDALRASGTTVILATGRSPWEVAPIAADLDLAGPHVMVNGGTFSTPGDGQVVWARHLAPDLVRDSIAFARQFGTRPIVNFVHRQVIEGTSDGSNPTDVSDFIRGPHLHTVDSLDEIALSRQPNALRLVLHDGQKLAREGEHEGDVIINQFDRRSLPNTIAAHLEALSANAPKAANLNDAPLDRSVNFG